MAALASAAHAAVSIREADHEDRAHFVISTVAAEYWLDRQAGGLSRLIDPDGRDWISFRKEPLAKFPESAAAGYRGIPNAVYGKSNPEAGAGHPGFERCTSARVSGNEMRCTSRSGRWEWTWIFTDAAAWLRFERVDPEHAYWFLYEGTPGGRFRPAEQYWGTDLGGPNGSVPTIKSQHFGRWRWAYFGDRIASRVLAVAQVQPDEIDDTFWYLGSTNGGAADSADGMVVFGFGRGRGGPLFRQPAEFVIALIGVTGVDAGAHARTGAAIQQLLQERPEVGDQLTFPPAP